VRTFSDLERFEIVAKAFELETGVLAPGKSQAPGAGGLSPEERSKLFEPWSAKNMATIRRTIMAIEHLGLVQ